MTDTTMQTHLDMIKALTRQLAQTGDDKLPRKTRQRIQKQVNEMNRQMIAHAKASNIAMGASMEMGRCIAEDIMLRCGEGDMDWESIEKNCMDVAQGHTRRWDYYYRYGIVMKLPLGTYEDADSPWDPRRGI